MATITSINISPKKGTFKQPVKEAELRVDFGIVGDAHAGNWHRQISLLAQESIDKMTALGNDHGATIIKRMAFNDKCDWNALKGKHQNTQQGLRAAVARGNLTHERAVELGMKAGAVTQ